MANRQTLKDLIVSTIYDNLLRKITAPKHQELELQIMDSVVTKEDDIINNFSSSAADKVASAGTVKTLNDTTLKLGRFQTTTAWLNQSTIPEGDYDVTFENVGQNLFGYNHFKVSIRYLNLGTEYIQLLESVDGRKFRRSNVLNVYGDFEEVTVGEGSGITSVVAGENVEIDVTDPKKPVINVPVVNGTNGRGIVSRALTSSVGLVDTYTTTYTDGTTDTYTVTNGANGSGTTNNSTTELTSLDWNISTDGCKKKITLTADTTINTTITDGEEASLLVDGNGYSLTIGGKTITTSASDKTLFGIFNFAGEIIVLSQELTIYIPPVPSDFDSDTDAFISVTGISNEIIKGAVNELVLGLKNNSIWDKMIAIYPLVGGTSTTHKFNLKNPVDSDNALRLSINGAIQHSENGMHPLGQISDFADTHLIPANSEMLNDFHLSFYSRTDIDGLSVDVGSAGTNGTSLFMFPKYNGNLYYDFTTNRNVANSLATTGFFVATRNSVKSTIFQNNNKIVDQTENIIQISNSSIYLCANNNAGVAAHPSGRELAFASIGKYLNDSEVYILKGLIDSFQTTLGRNI